jgi:aminopeptidase N
MKKISLILLLLLGTAAYGQDMEAIIKGEREAFTSKRAIKKKRSGQSYDVVYHNMKLTIDPAVRTISGSIFTELVSSEADFTNFAFDLDTRMIVDSVMYMGGRVPHTQANDEVTITIPAQPKDTRVGVTVYYRGNPSVNEQKAFSYDYQLAGPIAWTLSEPYGAYGWWPCKQQLTDKIDSMDFEITVPKGNKVASLGLLSAVDTLADSSLTFHWKHRYPVATYLVAVAVTNYYEQSRYVQLSGGDSVYHLEYLYPAYKPAADTLSGAIDGMLRGFDSLFGDYPFKKEKYGHAQFGRGGGMEHQTMSFMSDLSFDLMAHELAHQWFGNKVTCGSWQDLWLNEGWATYGNAIARELIHGKESFLEFITTSNERATRNPNGAVYAYDTVNVNNLFFGDMRYRKGAMVLHQLRWELGDSAFFAGTRNYLADATLCYGFAITPDFQAAMEQASGKDLTDYFDRYVYKEGWPDIVTRWNRVIGEGIKLKLVQTTSHESVPFFPVTIQYLAKGANRDSLFTIEHTTPNQEAEIYLGFKVTELIYDPNVWLIGKGTVLETKSSDFSNVNIFPNPAHNKLGVYLYDKKIDSVEVIDLQGQLVLSQAIIEQKNKVSALDISFLQDGVYFVKVHSGDETVVLKFVKTVYVE